jgi:phospholipid/cholesterol/gamma-HCH transport system permease protein
MVAQSLAEVGVERVDGGLVVTFRGDWRMAAQLPSTGGVFEAVDGSAADGVERITFDTRELGAWDTSLVATVRGVLARSRGVGLACSLEGLPGGVVRVLELIERSKSDVGEVVTDAKKKVGCWKACFMGVVDGAMEMLEFIGAVCVSLFKIIRGKSKFRWGEFCRFVQETGYESLPIVSLISFLIGLIMAFVGAVQLSQVGASIFVANLVGLAMVREMGAMMTAIILSGRTGAAFAASIGSMKINEEIDALKTFGIEPMEMLVIPRLLALCFMMPLLCIFSDFIGILGGFFVAVSMLDLSFHEYFVQTKHALSLTSCSIGITKSFVFGTIIAGFGCLRGFRCGSDAEAVGFATTRSVVMSITGLVIADAIFAFLLNMLNL